VPVGPVAPPGAYGAYPGHPLRHPKFGLHRLHDKHPAMFGHGPPPGPPHEPSHGPIFDVSWRNGVFFQSPNRTISLHVGAAVHYDFAWYSVSPVVELGTGKFNDNANLRRARIFFEGVLYDAVDYKFEMEFINWSSPAGYPGPVLAAPVSNSPAATDAWITIKDVPYVGNIRIGNQKEWFSLERLNSYRYLEFLERSYLFDLSMQTLYNNGFTPGISFFRTWLEDRVFSAIGFYKNESELLGFGLNDGQYAVTGRLAALPVWMPDECIFWHVGGAMSHRDPVNDQVQIRIRDHVRNAPLPLLPLVANTGPIGASSQDLFNVETAVVSGPLTLQAEYTANVIRGASVAGVPQGDLVFQGAYVEALVLLTGESRTWNTREYVFNRVIPNRSLRVGRCDCDGDCDGYGLGAWELGVRYTYLDVSNKAVQAGQFHSLTFGLNWYLNANAKLQFNYDFARRLDTGNPLQGNIHSFGLRTAFDF
jgi:phosphate-selective porin OprO/OprP